jgi:hypothetical protein
MERDTFGYYGLIVKPSFDEVLDAAKKPLRIPIPNRKAKREALNFYHAKLLDLQQKAMGYDLSGMQHAVDGQTIPELLYQIEQIGPSKSADSAVFDNMAKHAQSHFETKREQALRHRVDEEARDRMEGERRSQLSDAYFQGKGNAILEGEVPLETHLTTVTEQGPAQGYEHPRVIPVAAPRNMPEAAGYPAHPEFPTFRELNMGQVRPRGTTGFKTPLKTGDSYETIRRVSVIDGRAHGP